MSFAGPYGVDMLTLIFVQVFPRSDDRRTPPPYSPPAKSSVPIAASEWKFPLRTRVQFFPLSVERWIPQGMGACERHFVPAKRLPPMAARAVMSMGMSLWRKVAISSGTSIRVQVSPLSVERNMG